MSQRDASTGDGGLHDGSTNHPIDASPDSGGDAAAPEPPAFLTRHDTSALWLWADAETAHAFVTNRWEMADNLMVFASAPHGESAYAINRIFFEARTYSRDNIYDEMRSITYDPLLTTTEQAHLRAFNALAHSHGIAIEYLDGQAIWLADDDHAEWPKQVCRDVVTFNRTTTLNAERLDGVHLDIEPHTVGGTEWDGDWWENRLPDGYNAEWTQRWKEIMTSCRATLDAYAAETGHYMTLTLDLGADIAYYNKPLLDFLNGPDSPVDYITLMNYYDNRPNQEGNPSFFYGEHDGEAITGGVVQNLELWTQTPLVFGMETGPTGIAEDFMSFYQEGYQEMFSVIDTLQADYSQPRMMGYAVHPWGSYKDMMP